MLIPPPSSNTHWLAGATLLAVLGCGNSKPAANPAIPTPQPSQSAHPAEAKPAQPAAQAAATAKNTAQSTVKITVSTVNDFSAVSSAYHKASVAEPPQTLEITFAAGTYTGSMLSLGTGIGARPEASLIIRGPSQGPPAILDRTSLDLVGQTVRVEHLILTGRNQGSHALKVSARQGVHLEGLRFVRRQTGTSATRGSMQDTGLVGIQARAPKGSEFSLVLRDLWFLGNTLQGQIPLLKLRRSTLHHTSFQGAGLLAIGNTPTDLIQSNAREPHELSDLQIDLGGGAVLHRFAHPDVPGVQLSVNGAQRADNTAWVKPAGEPAVQLSKVSTAPATAPADLERAMDRLLDGSSRPTRDELTQALGW